MGDRTDINDDSSTYVTARSAGAADPWTAQSGGKAAQRLLDVAGIPAPGHVAEGLRLAGGAPVIVRRRLMLYDGRPVELTDSYYPASIAVGTGLAERRKIRGGAPTLLAELGFTACQVVEDVSARPASAGEAETLAIDEGAFVLVLVRTSHAADGTPFEVSTMVMRPEGRHLRYRLTVS
ncbi:UTRA domain-containing protein [Nocardiopsis sp. NPDC049922]|uniref:GntR family transcriptional regulator n=1 Tax=Nocardiopsis sp. NPDC049922 TaxID=3155157 RepID=UPI0033FFD4EB